MKCDSDDIGVNFGLSASVGDYGCKLRMVNGFLEGKIDGTQNGWTVG